MSEFGKDGRWRSKQTAASRRPHSDPQLLSMILPAVSQAMHLPEKVAEMAVMRLWPEVASPSCRPPATKAMGIKRVNGKVQLMVSTANAHIATQLTYEQDQVLGRLNCYAPQTGLRVDRIVVRVHNQR